MYSIQSTEIAAKTAHVNLMTDTVIANLNAETLRAVIRSMLAGDQEGQLASTFQNHVQKYLRRDIGIKSATTSLDAHAAFHNVIDNLNNLRMQILALLGCGLALESLGIISEIVQHSAPLLHRVDLAEEDSLLSRLAAVDADLVQALTAIQSHFNLNGVRGYLPDTHIRTLTDLKQSLEDCQRENEAQGTEFIYERGMDMLDGILSTVKR